MCQCCAHIQSSGKPKQDSISSYKPVSLTAVLCRVLERLVCKHLLCYLNNHDNLSDDQYGFQNGRNSKQILVNFHHFLSSNLDNSEDCNLVDGIFLDLSAAFDRVDHSVLLHKLYNYRIRCNMLGWILSFLSDRKQRVVFQGCYSDWVPVSSGVPQGSVLGPILFLLFVNDINNSLSSPLFQFADDHSIVRCIRSFQDHQALQNYLDKIHLWTLKNNRPPNASKCAVVNFSRSSSHSLYNLGGFKIKVANDFKLLGVVFNSSLSFSSHVDSVCKKSFSLDWFLY